MQGLGWVITNNADKRGQELSRFGVLLLESSYAVELGKEYDLRSVCSRVRWSTMPFRSNSSYIQIHSLSLFLLHQHKPLHLSTTLSGALALALFCSRLLLSLTVFMGRVAVMYVLPLAP